MAGKRLLLPQNFTPNDRKALDFVVDTFGQLEDVEVTLFHAYTRCRRWRSATAP